MAAQNIQENRMTMANRIRNTFRYVPLSGFPWTFGSATGHLLVNYMYIPPLT